MRKFALVLLLALSTALSGCAGLLVGTFVLMGVEAINDCKRQQKELCKNAPGHDSPAVHQDVNGTNP